MPKTDTQETNIQTELSMDEGASIFMKAQEAFSKVKKDSKTQAEYLQAVEPLLDEFSQVVRNNGNVELLLGCPIGVTYFFKFLQTEFNSENLQAYIDTIKFRDLVEKESSSISELQKEKEEYYINYLHPESLMEVNISGPLRITLLDVMDALEKLSDDSSALESWKTTMVEKILPEVIKELLSNLNDPFGRYKHSKYFRELCMWVFSDSAEEYRDRISQKKNNQLILNDIIQWDKELKVPHPLKIVSDAMGYLTELLQMEKFWTEEGTLDHEKVQNDRSCKSWIFMNELICQLQVVDLKQLSEKERLVFFINTFNLMMVHGSIASGGVSFTVLQRTIFLKETFYNIGGELYSIDTVLNGILRGNVNYSTSLSFNSSSQGRFSKNDPRRQFIIPYTSPDILFALMTLTSVTPDLVIYNVESFDSQLKETKEKFIKKHVIVNETSKLLVLPNIFMEFKRDFKQKNQDVETSIQSFVGPIVDKKLTGYKLKETDSNLELNYFGYIPNQQFKEKMMKIRPIEKKESKSRQQTLQEIVALRLEKVKDEAVPFEDVESLTKTQISGWILKFLSSNSGIEFTTKKTLFKTYENSFTTDRLLTWFEKQNVLRERALEFLTKIHSMNVVLILSGPSKITDSTKQNLQIQTPMLDHLEEDCIYSSVLIKKNNFFSKTSYQVYLYPNALILTDQGKVVQSIKLGSYDCGATIEGTSNCYRSIVQKSANKKTPQFEFVVLPYTAEKFTTKSHEETDKWMESFAKVKGATVVEEQQEDVLKSRFSLFRKSSSMYKIKNLEKKASLVEMAK
eukprot:gene2203-2377_t